ncbi:MAG: hypothetical protein CTY25_08755 [Methylobacterium sp.]|nr:MAG: hypothetical protein CTY25_08755 [Methylobacterium sp.]
MAMPVAGSPFSNWLERIGWARKKSAEPLGEHLDEYVTSYPSHQNAINALPGWNQAFPDDLGLEAGRVHLHHDPRILWAIEQIGPLAGKRVLEIGPLEAGHTWLLDQQGPALIDAVEANKLCYLRCLVTKEILQMKSARFHLGDSQLWLEQRPDRYDFVIASGVLYHMQDPIRFLEAVAARTDAIFLWTHYADDAAMPPGDPRRGAFVGEPEVRHHLGLAIHLHPRSYLGAWKDKAFCGGMHDLHRWIDRTDLLAFLGRLGFDDLRIWNDEPQHAFGPAFCVFARRSQAQGPVSEAG